MKKKIHKCSKHDDNKDICLLYECSGNLLNDNIKDNINNNELMLIYDR